MIKEYNITQDFINKMEILVPGAFKVSDKQRNERIVAITIIGLFTIISLWKLEINPFKIFLGTGKFFQMLLLFFPPTSGGFLFDYIFAMGETLAMAFLGTLFGFLFAAPLGFLAAKNVISNSIIHIALRRFFDVIRGINVLIWALMFVNVAGLGPFAGIMAIIITDTATLAKLFSEFIENVDTSQIDGTKSTGANPIQIIRYAFIPQVLPIMLSNVLYFFEANVREASILGILGAGGIGMQLYDRIRIMNWPQVFFIIIMILITVAVIDTISKEIRKAIVANPEYRP